MENKVHENEVWWQENGLAWGDEVDRRRSLQPLYGIQEVILSHIFSKLPKKSKVMEFGVGFGRHIEYLSDIPELEVYGVDQSSTMLKSLKDRLAHKPKLIENVTLIEPRSKLPYPDGFFDFVYTVSVLIHIDPSDLKDILKELSRVSKHGIIHFENNFVEHSELKFMDHNGCWQQSIINDYKELGLSCDIFEKVASEQDVYYTNISGEWSKDDFENSVMFSRLHLMDSKVRPTIAEFEGEIGWRTKELAERIENERIMKDQIVSFLSEKSINEQKLKEQESISESLRLNIIDKLQQIKEQENINERLRNDIQDRLQQLEEQKYENSKLNSLYHNLIQASQLQENTLAIKQQEIDQLMSHKIFLETKIYEIESSLAWRVISKIRGMHYLYTFAKPARKILNAIRSYRNRKHLNSKEVDYSNNEARNVFLDKEDSKKNGWLFDLLMEIPEGSSVAIHQPEWLGVTNSTKELFSYVIPLKELYEPSNILNIGQLIASRKPKAIIFSGFAVGYFDLAKVIKKIEPDISIKIYWHGNTTHMYEDYSWSRYQEIIQLCNDGIIDSWGFAKESMKILYENAGYSSYFIKNDVKGDLSPNVVSKSYKFGDEIKVGIYASGSTWNKNAFTQIAAASLLDRVTVNAVPYNSRMKHFAQQLKVKFEGSEKQLSREELFDKIESNDINFYVTFSECAPLLPLESLNRGVPCLTGPNHHYFTGNPLEEFLVVMKPDDPVEISKKAILALENRKLIIELYNKWKKENELVSETSVLSFLEGK
ncbi:class I SAM-dependent methyltransferase [Paenibacillus sp. USHLN196]|uniref:class I SAM-dependent methyltransferase n=1 Tax=Paenibacillus sp. USHLN196 TaxID=3081291 RepID=UPI0030176D55